MNNYLAITIGPIHKTFENVRKTRELWAASYIFSYLSKRLIEEISKLDAESVISPHFGETPVGIGLFPDRIFVAPSPKVDKTALENIKERVICEIALWLQDNNAEIFLKNYFRIVIIEYQIAASQHPLKIGNQLLDQAELCEKWELNESSNLLLSFFRNVNKLRLYDKKWLPHHLNERDIFGEIRFESLPEIATRVLQGINQLKYKELVKKYCYSGMEDIDDDDGFIIELKTSLNSIGQDEVFKNNNKYICIVVADGDKVGKYINNIDSDYVQQAKLVSKALFDWGIKTAGLIKVYKGVPVYIGGDDLLFIAPVTGCDDRNILDLLTHINDGFVKSFDPLPVIKDDAGIAIKPTLSFGVSITYFKFPLYEALKKADELLRSAKESGGNTCCVTLLKHSGSSFDISLSNDLTDPVRNQFDLVSKFFSPEKSYLSSIIHHFRQNETVYSLIGIDGEKTLNFLQNNFDDNKHKSFVKEIAGLCTAVYQKHLKAKLTSKESVHELFSLLRILKFMKGLDDGK